MHKAIALTRDLIAIPSVNPMGKNLSGDIYSEREVARYIYEFLKPLGVDVEIMGVDPEHPNVVARIDAGCAETVMLEAHMDTVPYENMTIDPFDPVIKDGLLFGRGSCDTKASLATYLYAISYAINSKRRFSRNIILAGVYDEEYSFGGARELINNGIRATFAVAGEPTSLNIIYAHKGVCRFLISTKGKSAHAALPWLGESAIYSMGHVLEKIESYAKFLSNNVHAELGPPTINVGRIYGGDAVNIVPSSCTVEIDRRLLPGEEFDEIRAALDEHLITLKDQIKIHDPYLLAHGVFNDKNSHACQSLANACASVKWIPEFKTAHYGTDASIFSKSGIPTIVFGPGSVDFAHTEAEHVPTQDIEKASDIILNLITGG